MDTKIKDLICFRNFESYTVMVTVQALLLNIHSILGMGWDGTLLSLGRDFESLKTCIMDIFHFMPSLSVLLLHKPGYTDSQFSLS